MTANFSDRTGSEPTLTDIVEKLDQLSREIKKIDTEVNKKIDDISAENKKFDDRFTNYQQATQWVVQLAFTLIASATITIIVTTILRR